MNTQAVVTRGADTEALVRSVVRASAVAMPVLVLAGYLARGWCT